MEMKKPVTIRAIAKLLSDPAETIRRQAHKLPGIGLLTQTTGGYVPAELPLTLATVSLEVHGRALSAMLSHARHLESIAARQIEAGHGPILTTGR